MRKIVTRAIFHDIQANIPGLGNMEKQLPLRGKTVHTEMWLDSEYPGVLQVVLGQGPSRVEAFIPLANVQICFTKTEV